MPAPRRATFALALALTATALVPCGAHAQVSLSARAEQAPPPPPRGTHVRWTHAALGGVMVAVRVRSPFATVGASIGFDTAFHPHHEVGVRISDTLHVPSEAGGPDIIGQWIAVATDYR